MRNWFNVGDKVVCIVKNEFWYDENKREVYAPIYGEVLIIDFIHRGFFKLSNGKITYNVYLGFNKYHTLTGYNSRGFEKIDKVVAKKALKEVVHYKQ